MGGVPANMGMRRNLQSLVGAGPTEAVWTGWWNAINNAG